MGPIHLQSLQDSYDFCEDIAQQQLQGIVERLVHPTDPEINEVKKKYIDKAMQQKLCL